MSTKGQRNPSMFKAPTNCDPVVHHGKYIHYFTLKEMHNIIMEKLV